MKERSVFVPREYHKGIEEYAEHNCHPRRKVGGWRGLSSAPENSVDSVVIEITEDPKNAGDMAHTYTVPLSEIAE